MTNENLGCAVRDRARSQIIFSSSTAREILGQISKGFSAMAILGRSLNVHTKILSIHSKSNCNYLLGRDLGVGRWHLIGSYVP
jgi:hypothetical protein